MFLLSGILLISTYTNKIKVTEGISIKSIISNTNNGEVGVFKSNKFAFKYPGGWSVSVKDTTINEDSSTFVKLKHGDEKVKIILYQSKDVYDVDSYTFMNIFEQEESNNYDIYNIIDQDIQSYKINGNPTNNVLIEYEGKDSSGKALDIFQVIDDKIFVLRYYSPNNTFEKNIKEINDLLDSIKINK